MDTSNISVNTQNSIRIESKKIIYADPLDIGHESHDADYIFITHDHYDHLSVPDILKIMNENTVLVVPAPIEARISKSTPVNNLICVEPGKRYMKLSYYQNQKTAHMLQ